MIADYLWFFAVAIGPALMLGVFVYSLLKRRRLSRSQEAQRDEATRQLFDKDGRDPQG